MSARRFAMFFKDPLGDSRADVFGEVEANEVRMYPGSREEPADYAITPVRLSLGDADFYGKDLEQPRLRKVVSHIMEYGGSK